MVNADLHTHTYYSDGGTTPEQNVQLAVFRGLETIAIADHDTLAGIDAAQKEAAIWGIEFVPAVEISTPDYHILGYNFERTPAFEEFVAFSRDCQRYRTERKVKMLQEQGYSISMESIDANNPPGARLGSFNIATQLVRENPAVREISLNDVYRKIVKPLPDFDSDAPTVQQTVDAIHAAGGLAVFAHPPRDAKSIAEVEAVLDTGIDGIEVQPNFYHAKEAVTYQEIEALAKKRGLFISAGSDFHGPAFDHRPMLKEGSYPIERFW